MNLLVKQSVLFVEAIICSDNAADAIREIGFVMSR